MLHRASKSEFVHEIVDRGNIESANNVEIKCEVKAKGGGGTTILEIVPEGTYVRPGDVLVRLDSSLLENERTAQLINCNNSKAALIQAQRVLETAQISLQEYIGGQSKARKQATETTDAAPTATTDGADDGKSKAGTYEQAKQAIDNEIYLAKEDLSKAEQYLEYSKRLAAKGFISSVQLRNDAFAVDKYKNALEIAETKLHVLQNFTKEKTIVQLEADIKTAEAKLDAARATHELDKAQLALIESQIEKCVIKSPEEGQVVYANITGWRGTKEFSIAPGEQVRERQVIIRLPDPKKMQVVAKINEAKITQIEVGMPATIRLDAFPELELHGAVDRVSEFPVPTSWMGSSVKEYETMVRIHESPPGLKPGLTAEVRICVERTPDVLQVPVQAIFEHGNKYYCIAAEGKRLNAREVKIGSTNDKTVIIADGISEGDLVVLNAMAYRDKVALPDLPAESRGSMVARGDSPPGASENRAALRPTPSKESGAPPVVKGDAAPQPGAPRAARPNRPPSGASPPPHRRTYTGFFPRASSNQIDTVPFAPLMR